MHPGQYVEVSFDRPSIANLDDDSPCSERKGGGQWDVGGVWVPTQLLQVGIQWVVAVVFR